MLIGFGVVILPALLGGKGPQFGEEGSAVTPRLDSKVFVSKITPIGGATPQLTPAPAQTAATVPVVEAQPTLPAKTAEPPAETKVATAKKVDPKPKATPKPESTPAAGVEEPGWVVRVGTFARQDNVDRVVKRLRQAGFEPSTTDVKTQTGSVTRVWIGPYGKRVEAARMRTRVQQVTGGEGYIAAYP